LSLKLQKWGTKKYARGFSFTVHKNELETPLHWRKARMVFVNSMSDFFHEDMPEDVMLKAFDTMSKADWHTYQILTKRPERMVAFFKKYPQLLKDNIWVGTTVENNKHLDRIELLKQIPAKVKFISFEPLLGPLGDIKKVLKGIDWVIVGGESGFDYRAMDLDWAKEIRDNVLAMGKDRPKFFFKQVSNVLAGREKEALGKIWHEMP
jgi:protein gp37